MAGVAFNNVHWALPSSTTSVEPVLRTVFRVLMTLPAKTVAAALASLLMAHVWHHSDVLLTQYGMDLLALVLKGCF